MANNYYKNTIITIIILMLLALLLVVGVKNFDKRDNNNIPSEPNIVKQGKLGDDIHPKKYFIYEYNIDGEIYYDMEIID